MAWWPGWKLLVNEPDIIYFTIGATVYDADPFFMDGGDYHRGAVVRRLIEARPRRAGSGC